MNTAQTQPQVAKGKVLTGIVVKTAMKDTVTVSVERYVKHPKYKKYLRRSKKYLVHSPNNEVRVGDKVVIQETKPLSKRKRFVLIQRISSKPVAENPDDLVEDSNRRDKINFV